MRDHDYRSGDVSEEIARRAPALLFSLDRHGRLDFTNERWEEMVGCDARELLGDGWMSYVHPDDLSATTAQWRQQVEAGAAFLLEFRLRRADGTFRWVEIQAEPAIGGDGSVRQWFGAAVDVDARRRAVAALDLLAASGAAVAGTQDVALILTRMAEASLGGIEKLSSPPAAPGDALAGNAALAAGAAVASVAVVEDES
jgi:PAS domain S-box-containing protein